MTRSPLAIGLLLCDRVIVTRHQHPVGDWYLYRLAVEHFPSDSQRSPCFQSLPTLKRWAGQVGSVPPE